MFVGAVAVLGARVRIMRAATGQTVTAQPALDLQLAASDSARLQQAAGRQAKEQAGRQRRRARGRGDSTAGTHRGNPAGSEAFARARGRGYVNGKLDLDIATAAQIDSLPGIVPGVARRIIADRMMLGPFFNRDGLRRVGLSPKVLRQLDTLATFSGSFSQPSPGDTVIPRSRKARWRRSRTPAPH